MVVTQAHGVSIGVVLTGIDQCPDQGPRQGTGDSILGPVMVAVTAIAEPGKASDHGAFFGSVVGFGFFDMFDLTVVNIDPVPGFIVGVLARLTLWRESKNQNCNRQV